MLTNIGGTCSITRQKKNSSGSPEVSCWLSKRHGSLLPQGLLIIEKIEVVSGSNEAFGLFHLKNYQSLPTRSKKSSYTDVRTDDTIEPEFARDKQDANEDVDKDDDGEMETVSETDAVDAARSGKKTRKEKLSGTKLKEAMNDFQAWYQRLDELWDWVDCTGEKLAWEIEDYCISVKKKAAEKHTGDTNFLFDGCIHLTTKQLNDLPDRK